VRHTHTRPTPAPQRPAHPTLRKSLFQWRKASRLPVSALTRIRSKRPDESEPRRPSLRRCRINYCAHLRHPVRRKPTLRRMLPNRSFIRRNIYAVDFIVCNVTVQPLNLRPHLAQYAARRLRHRLQLFRAQFPNFRNLPLDNELRHSFNLTARRVPGSGYRNSTHPSCRAQGKRWRPRIEPSPAAVH